MKLKKVAVQMGTFGLLFLLSFGVTTLLLKTVKPTSYQMVQKIEDTKNTTSKKETKKEVKKPENNISSAKKTTLPNVKETDWQLILVGPNNQLEKEVDENKLTSITDTWEIDSRIKADFEDFQKAAKKAGYPISIVSTYRTIAYQKEIFNQSVQQLISEGETKAEATRLTKLTMTEPGFSEHHTGLAIDMVDSNWYKNYTTELLDASYGAEPGAKWYAENAATYGFIVRYPKGKEKITGITYEPWHFRYVGKENAQYIYKHGLTLEEYLEQLKEE